MDYARIYREFVADRLGKQPDAPTYFERHHVMPKSLGGGDEPENIIRLTPEDHFFAHLLLSKIHGGAMWAAVLCMARMDRSHHQHRIASLFSLRLMVGIARRRYAKYRAVSQTGVKVRGKRETHTIHHIDGRSMTGALADLAEWTGISFASVSRLASRKQGMTYSGWFMFVEERDKALSSKRKTGIGNFGSAKGGNRKAVRCNETGQVFGSITEASIAVGAPVKNAFKAGRSKAGGFTWSFA